jgi:hypothetical protein
MRMGEFSNLALPLGFMQATNQMVRVLGGVPKKDGYKVMKKPI